MSPTVNYKRRSQTCLRPQKPLLGLGLGFGLGLGLSKTADAPELGLGLAKIADTPVILGLANNYKVLF